MSTELSVTLPAYLVEEVAQRVATIVTAEINMTATTTPYMTVAEAADYLRWSKERIYELTRRERFPTLHPRAIANPTASRGG